MEITPICYDCGNELAEARTSYPKHSALYVVPCVTCLADARSLGHTEGFNQGQSEGYDEGLAAGEAAVRDDVVAMMTLVKEADCTSPTTT